MSQKETTVFKPHHQNRKEKEKPQKTTKQSIIPFLLMCLTD
jgi:hypothetical protein